ncbi:hypothetical protein [Streptomyces sp. Go-475]|uniref:hypothetical protein n=1 Tax=Streptomyces sp. Go-475 TaxID=2072505 RepID=UPI000DEFBC05|nr:hypothetical protein [Streptomyces sp. Go-475]AXE85742.1 hypothetical protein C1703_12075 [Streptomyces sp. Go-475]
MTPKGRLAIIVIGLITFTALVITLLVLGQPATAIGPLILVIVLGVQQLLQTLEAGSRRDGGPPRPPTALPPTTRAVEGGDRPATEDGDDDKKAA